MFSFFWDGMANSNAESASLPAAFPWKTGKLPFIFSSIVK